MRTTVLAMISILVAGMLIAPSVGMEKGENLIRNSDFEAGHIGDPPGYWQLASGGG